MKKKSYIIDNKVLMSEWDYEKNKDLDPSKLTYGSNKKVWWKCHKCRGSWQTTIYERTGKHGTNCPYCASQKVLKGYNDLATKYPEAIKQWNVEKNKNLQPYDVMAGSNKKVWWKCSKGHEFEQSVAARIKHIASCPICSGQKILKGCNDLASQYPNVAKEWNYTKNGNVTPYDRTWGSNKKAWWKCSKCNHEWQARISDRTRDRNGCPACANKVLVRGYNDLATKFPNIAKEWHPTKNGTLKPTDVKYGSDKKVWWLCNNNHEYEQAINIRTTRKTRCPYCASKKGKLPKVLKDYNDLATKYPEAIKQWNVEKNKNLKPYDVTAGSKKEVWWKCSKGHEFKQAINHRIRHIYSCPVCSGHKALEGYNDFKTIYPEIAKEWHPTKNGTLKPTDVTSGSGKKVWWICPSGHEYKASIHDRGSGHTNCSICNMRKSSSFPEQAIFYYLKQIFSDSINRYNKIFDTSMELDIYIPSQQCAVEYDGAQWHRTNEEHLRELKKYQFCKEHDITLYRIKETPKQKWLDTADKIYYVKKVKRKDFVELEKIITNIISDITKSSTILDINIQRDKYKIQSYLSSIKNSLQDLRPDVAKKWNYDKNGSLLPSMFSVGSSEIVWWKCLDCGHEWKCSISSMTRAERYGCAICSNKRRGKTFTKRHIKKVGSLADTHPEMAKDWHPTKNGTLKPTDIVAGTNKPVWWLCKKCGYEWKGIPNNRKKGIGCPCCSGRVPKKGKNDLVTTHPEMAKDWHPTKNGILKPTDVKAGSGKIVWWKCSKCGYEFKTEVRKYVKNHKCSNCERKKGKQLYLFDV